MASKAIAGGRVVPQTLVFSSLVYSVETIKKAAYRFSDIISVDLVVHDGQIECSLHFLSPPKSAEDERPIVFAFRNEVLDQDLRAIIAKETEPVRNAILAYAFSRTGLQGRE